MTTQPPGDRPDGPETLPETPPRIRGDLGYPPALQAEYRPVRRLGGGAFGVVYEAREVGTEARVAIKVLHDPSDQDLLDRFFREAEGLARIRHPNVVEIYRFGCLDGTPYLVLEYLDGVPLGKLEPGSPESPRNWLAIMLDVAEGLSEAHAAGLLHRDVKPANIMLTHQGRSVLIDFGMARDPRSSRITQTGQVVGTLAYVHPTRLAGRPEEAADDWYAWAVSLYELLEGELPFRLEQLLLGVHDPDILQLGFHAVPEGSPVADLLAAMLLGPEVPEGLRSRGGIESFLQSHPENRPGPRDVGGFEVPREREKRGEPEEGGAVLASGVVRVGPSAPAPAPAQTTDPAPEPEPEPGKGVPPPGKLRRLLPRMAAFLLPLALVVGLLSEPGAPPPSAASPGGLARTPIRALPAPAPSSVPGSTPAPEADSVAGEVPSTSPVSGPGEPPSPGVRLPRDHSAGSPRGTEGRLASP